MKKIKDNSFNSSISKLHRKNCSKCKSSKINIFWSYINNLIFIYISFSIIIIITFPIKNNSLIFTTFIIHIYSKFKNFFIKSYENLTY